LNFFLGTEVIIGLSAFIKPKNTCVVNILELKLVLERNFHQNNFSNSDRLGVVRVFSDSVSNYNEPEKREKQDLLFLWMEGPLVNLCSSINMGSWAVLFGQVDFEHNTMFGISIFGCKTQALSLVTRGTGETREKANGIDRIVVLPNFFWANNPSPDRELSLLVGDLLVVIIKELYHCCIISFNVLELGVSHGNVDGVVGSVVSISLNHSFKATELVELLVVTELVKELEQVFPVVLLLLVDVRLKDLAVLFV
jgi:hypothetical protein